MEQKTRISQELARVSCMLLDGVKQVNGGGREIRTHEGRKPLPVFKTGAFNRSASPPGFLLLDQDFTI